MNVNYFKTLWKSSLMILMLCFGLTSVWGQTIIFSENMGTTASNGAAIGTYTGFQNNGILTFSGTGDMRTTSVSSGYTEASGSINVMLNANNETFIIDGINASTFTNLVLSFGVRKGTNAETGSTFNVEYSTTGAGGTFTAISWGTLPSGQNGWYYRSSTSTIPNTVTTIRFRSTSTVDFRIDDVKLTGTPATPCDEGTLTGGTTVSNVSEVASGGSVNLSLDGASTGSGLTYQWQSSANGADWSDIDGATTATYSATDITAATYFRAAVTCGETTVTSTPILINVIYCTPTADSNDNTGITQVSFSNLNNTAGGSAGTYTDFTNLIADVIAGENYNLTVNVNTAGNFTVHTKAWIDWDKDYAFEVSEEYDLGSANNVTNDATSNSPLSINIPSDIAVGTYRMRIRTTYNVVPTACDNQNFSETEDYTISVTPAGPVLTVDPTTITGLQAIENGAALNSASFTLSGQNLDGEDVILIADEGFVLSTDEEGTYEEEITLTAFDGTETTIWVRLAAGQNEGPIAGDILISGGGADDLLVSVSGEVLSSDPILTLSEEMIDNLGYTFGAATSVPASFTISGLNMDGDGDVMLAFTESTDFEMSLAAEGTYTDYLLIEDYDGTETTIYVRLKLGREIGNSYADELEILTDYDVNESVLVFAEVTAPIINTNPDTIVPAMTAIAGETDTETVTVSGTLTADVTAQITGDDAGQFSVTASVTSAGGDLTVTYEPTTVGEHTATLLLSTNGGVTKELALSGTATLGVPVATAATLVGHESFTANWEAVVGADSYEIDVYTMVSGGFATDLFISEYVEGSSNNKAIEIYNGTGATVNLADYTIVHFNNGASRTSGTRYALQLSGNLESGNTYVIVNNSASEGLKAYADLITSSQALNFNGDDAIAIYRSVDITGTAISSSAIEIDLLGKIGEDPGTEWGTGLTSTSDNTLRRKSTISVGVTTNPSNFDPSLEWDGFATDTFDGLGSHTFDGGLTQVYMLQAENVGNVTSYEITGLDPETTYYYVVRAVAGETISANSDEIEVETLAAPTAIVWTTGNVWSNGDGPTIDDDAIIEGDLTLTLTGNLSAKTLTVAAGGKITVPANKVLTVDGAIINEAGAANFVVENDGILIQNTDAENTGAITVKRNSNPMFRLDYTLWSSPVAGMRLVDFSNVSPTSPAAGNGTLWTRVYTLGEAAWEQVWNSQPDFDNDPLTFTAAKGYLYRAPNDWVVRNNPEDEPADAYPGVFTGVPNNGEYSINTPNTFDAIGNPYPSPIYADDFILSNDVDAIYFWTNVNSSNGVAYTHNNWASYTTLGGVGVTIGDSGIIDPNSIPADNMHIQPGQGFVVYTEPETESVAFTNSMRVNSNGSFFRQMATEKSRFWLNLSNEEVVFNQILVGYMDNATQGVDTGIDGKMFAYEGNALYSIIDNNEDMFVIQGRSLPFTASDVVALGFRAVNAGSFTISLDNVDGLFAEGNTTIYLKDNFTQTQHNLNSGAYSFVSEEGIFDTRFEVVYQTTMSVENPVANNANWVVYSQENGYQIQTQGFELKTVQVFDLLGRAIYTASAEGTAHHIPSLGADSVYIVKVTTTDNVVLSKKVK